MGDENSEVNRANPALALEMNHLVDAHVIDHVGNQEGARGEEGGEHEFLVDLDLAGADRCVAGSEENGAGTV